MSSGSRTFGPRAVLVGLPYDDSEAMDTGGICLQVIFESVRRKMVGVAPQAGSPCRVQRETIQDRMSAVDMSCYSLVTRKETLAERAIEITEST